MARQTATDDANDSTDNPSVWALSAESTAHYGSRGLEDWTVIEAAMDATAATLRRVTETEQ